jgi:4-hydroxy-4-methyl-2-oxoglutarate aldolase
MSDWPYLATASIHEVLGQTGALPPAIAPVARGRHVSGPAFTVLCGPRDNLALHHAIASAPSGSVLVTQAGGWFDAGYFGGIMADAAAKRGLAGLVIDGCVRDSRELADGEFPVWARGLSIKGTTKDPLLGSALGVRLRFPGTDVDPGDLVVADDDGVVAVPAAKVPDVRTLVIAREDEEQRIHGRLARGETTMKIYGLPALTRDSR